MRPALVRTAAAALFAVSLAAAFAADPPAAARRPLSETTYRATQTVTVTGVPEGAKSVRVWCWVPEDRPEQKVLDLRVTAAPEGARLERDPKYGRTFLYAEFTGDAVKSPVVTTGFTVLRRETKLDLDPAKCGPLTPEHARTFADALRTDELNMEVTPDMQATADGICGKETNVVVQAHRIFDFVVDKGTDHYSLTGTAPTGKCLGSASECMAGAGDCCTDQHALFIALARARGIPTRLHFGSRLQPQNEGKDHDPGYRCWVTFFAPGYGWVPVECSAADKMPERREFYFGGLDDARLEFAEGRDHDLAPLQKGPRPDLVIRAYVEVDGKPHRSFTRNLRFTR